MHLKMPVSQLTVGYNGYLFHEEAEDRIYNPSMML